MRAYTSVRGNWPFCLYIHTCAHAVACARSLSSLLTLKRARRVVARLNKGAQEAQGRYVQFAADETRILADLKTVDNENVGGLAAAADTAAAAEDVDTAEAVAGDTQVASPAAEADTGLGDNSTAT